MTLEELHTKDLLALHNRIAYKPAGPKTFATRAKLVARIEQIAAAKDTDLAASGQPKKPKATAKRAEPKAGFAETPEATEEKPLSLGVGALARAILTLRLLQQEQPLRVINIGSSLMRLAPLPEQWSRLHGRYDMAERYGLSKALLASFTAALLDAGVAARCVDPGLVRTDLGAGGDALSRIGRALTSLFGRMPDAAAVNVIASGFYHDEGNVAFEQSRGAAPICRRFSGAAGKGLHCSPAHNCFSSSQLVCRVIHHDQVKAMDGGGCDAVGGQQRGGVVGGWHAGTCATAAEFLVGGADAGPILVATQG